MYFYIFRHGSKGVRHGVKNICLGVFVSEDDHNFDFVIVGSLLPSYTGSSIGKSSDESNNEDESKLHGEQLSMVTMGASKKPIETRK
jgi:hypothetical protein